MKASFLVNYKLIILIFCLGFSLRLFFVMNSREPIIKDGVTYDAIAVSLSSGRGFSLDGQHPTSQVAPLFSFYLALVYFIFGHNLQIALIIQAIIATITCLLTFNLAEVIFKNKNVAILSGIISTGYYYFISEGTRLWTETIFMFFLVLMVFSYLKMVRLRSMSYAVCFGVSGALLVLTRPIALFFPFMLIGIDGIRFFFLQKERLSSYIKVVSMAMFFFVFLIGLWAARNVVVQKEFVLVATGGGRNFYEAFNPYDGKKYGITVVDEVIRRGELIPSEVSRDRFYFKIGLESLFHKSIPELFKLTVIKGLTFWSLMDWGAMGNGKAVFNFCTSFILPFCIIAGILLRRNRYALFILLSPLVYFFFFSLVFMGVPRMRMPTEPFLIILAAYAILWLFERFSNKIIPVSIISVWLILNIVLFVNSEYMKIFFKRLVEFGGLW